MKKVFLVLCLFLGTSCQMFQRQPTGLSYYRSLWDQAVDLLRAQKTDEAEPLLREVYASAQSVEPELSTRALFELAEINERKGQWTQALAQFKECELKKKDLPNYKADLELPSRLAGLYATLGELQVSESYAKKVEANLQMYLQQVHVNQQKAWWAETFYHMGSFPVRFIDANNWMDFAKRFHSTSQYLIRSMEMGDPVWSERSLELAQNFFKKSFDLLSSGPTNDEENAALLGSVIRDRIDMLDVILQKIQLYKPLDLHESRVVWRFYQLVDDYQDQVKAALFKVRDAVPLSRESEKRNALERKGRLIDPSPSKAVDKTSKDPNL